MEPVPPPPVDLPGLLKEMSDLAMTIRQVGRVQIGRLLGTVLNTDGRYKAWIDLLERSMFLRAEVNALAKAMIDKGMMTEAEWLGRMVAEFKLYAKDLASQFPEVEFGPTGYTVKDVPAWHARCKAERWPP